VLTARTEITDRMLSSASGICGRSWPSMWPTTTDDGPIAAACSTRLGPTTLSPTSQEWIRRQPVLSGLINEYECAA